MASEIVVTQGLSPEKRMRRRERTLQTWLVLFLVALYFATFGGHLYSGDGVTMYETASSIVDGKGGALEGRFDDPRFSQIGRDGHRYSKYGLAMTVLDLPLAALGGSALGRFLASLLNIPITAFTCLLLYRMVCGRRGREAISTRWRAGLSVALLYGVATFAWTYSKLDFSEPLLALTYVLAASALFVPQLTPAAYLKAGAWLAVAGLVKPAALIILPAVLLYVVLRHNRNLRQSFVAVLWLAGPLALGILAILGWNIYRFGSVTSTGYDAISDQFVLGSIYGGVYGFLLSPGKSIFLYAPGLALALFGFMRYRRLHSAEAAFGLALVGTYIVFYSLFWNWEGDWSWGPRYLLPVTPFVALWAAPLFELQPRLWLRRAIIAVFGLGVLVNLLGVAVEFNYVFYVNLDNNINQDWRFIPELSPLRVQLVLVASAAKRAVGVEPLTLDYNAWDTKREHALRQVAPLAHVENGTIIQRYDQFDVFYLRSLTPNPGDAPNPILALFGLPLIFLVIYTGLRLRRAARRVAAVLPQEGL